MRPRSLPHSVDAQYTKWADSDTVKFWAQPDLKPLPDLTICALRQDIGVSMLRQKHLRDRVSTAYAAIPQV